MERTVDGVTGIVTYRAFFLDPTCNRELYCYIMFYPGGGVSIGRYLNGSYHTSIAFTVSEARELFSAIAEEGKQVSSTQEQAINLEINENDIEEGEDHNLDVFKDFLDGDKEE